MELKKRPLLTAGQIRKKVEEIAQRISADYAGRDLLLIAVLKGSLIFASDLMRRLTVPSSVDFIRARSYCQTHSQGRCDFLLLPEQPVTGRHVLVIEDIIDTGLTARCIVDYLAAQNPASLEICTLLDKPARRNVQIHLRYVGFAIDNEFVVGYGMDYEEQGRNRPDIHVLLGD
ncbi:MAG TPA: hypoxanthine phosphoribosyltransferase [Candidatus Bathyarchaeia archaeon]|nr:hypoxanthine phosphoribosyltransferase [Candidatus Bathyarchaeia archaeon]